MYVALLSECEVCLLLYCHKIILKLWCKEIINSQILHLLMRTHIFTYTHFETYTCHHLLSLSCFSFNWSLHKEYINYERKKNCPLSAKKQAKKLSSRFFFSIVSRVLLTQIIHNHLPICRWTRKKNLFGERKSVKLLANWRRQEQNQWRLPSEQMSRTMVVSMTILQCTDQRCHLR